MLRCRKGNQTDATTVVATTAGYAVHTICKANTDKGAGSMFILDRFGAKSKSFDYRPLLMPNIVEEFPISSASLCSFHCVPSAADVRVDFAFLIWLLET